MKSPLILAHRGASEVAPENTIAAFRRARDLGADGIELDVTLTRDQVPVIIHDDTVDRTTNGHGIVSSMTIHEIKSLDAGAWKSPQYRGETIPTLSEALDALADWARPTNVARAGVINVELKSSGIRSGGVERLVVRLIEQRKIEACVILSSFDPLALVRLRMLNQLLQRGLLYDSSLPIYLRRTWLRFVAAPHAMHPHHGLVDTSYMQWANRNNYSVNTWTVDEPGEARRLAILGVNAIITNTPDVLRDALSSAVDTSQG